MANLTAFPRDSHKSTSLLNFYDSISRINSKCSELITHGQDNTYMDPLPTLYPSPCTTKQSLSPCGGVGDNSGNHRTKSVKKNNSINQCNSATTTDAIKSIFSPVTNANGDDD
ncbi:unnamed protein product, partial [Trichobilharzia regenti]